MKRVIITVIMTRKIFVTIISNSVVVHAALAVMIMIMINLIKMQKRKKRRRRRRK